MKYRRPKKSLVLWCALLLIVTMAATAQATPCRLIAYVSLALLDSAGANLADGSVVLIFGSLDYINNGPVAPYGGNNPLVANSTQGDDMYLGYALIDMPSYNLTDGTFISDGAITFDTADINYFYIRFFDTLTYPVAGSNIAWNTSMLFGYTQVFGDAVVDFGGDIRTSVTNDFVVIPEPSTGHLLLLMLALGAGMRASMRKTARASKKGRQP
jgi:hypothetical protein